jgi:hypothetical protein
MDTLAALVKMTEAQEKDFRGAVRLTIDEVTKRFDSEFDLIYKPAIVNVMAVKGLLIQKITDEKGGVLAFDKEEFHSVYRFWLILHEIDKWNERGVVLMKEEKESRKKQIANSQCGSCKSPIVEEMKFCPNCGQKLN